MLLKNNLGRDSLIFAELSKSTNFFSLEAQFHDVGETPNPDTTIKRNNTIYSRQPPSDNSREAIEIPV